MTSQVLNFDVEGLIREVGHTPAQHKLVPNLKFSEVWLHAQDVALSAVKSRPKDEEHNQMLLKSYVKLLMAAQELADLHRRSSPAQADRLLLSRASRSRSRSRPSTARPTPPCTTLALPMSETALERALTMDGHSRLGEDRCLSAPSTKPRKCNVVEVTAIVPDWEDWRPVGVWRGQLLRGMGYIVLFFPVSIQVFYGGLAFSVLYLVCHPRLAACLGLAIFDAILTHVWMSGTELLAELDAWIIEKSAGRDRWRP